LVEFLALRREDCSKIATASAPALKRKGGFSAHWSPTGYA
jgi:hypothetical protein